MNVLPDVYILLPLEKKRSTKINKTGAIAKVRVLVEQELRY